MSVFARALAPRITLTAACGTPSQPAKTLLSAALAAPCSGSARTRTFKAAPSAAVVVGTTEPELIAMAWLQTSAAIGLGELDAPRAGEALLRFLDEDDIRNPQLLTPKCFAIMSLASYPSPATRERGAS